MVRQSSDVGAGALNHGRSGDADSGVGVRSAVVRLSRCGGYGSMIWQDTSAICPLSKADGWFVQWLCNGLWICVQNPAAASSWTVAELLYTTREDAIRACERRAAAAEERKALKVREWLS